MSSSDGNPSSRQTEWQHVARLKLVEIDDIASRTRELAFNQAEEQLRELARVARRFKVRRNSLLPVSRLPAEALCHIFSLAVMADIGPEDPVWDIVDTRTWAARDRTTITHVCHQWREIALSYPVLWTSIICGASEEYYAEVLSRSGTLPLTMSGDQGIGAGLAELARIEDLALSTTPSGMKDLGQGTFGPAPLLRSLQLECVHDNEDLLPYIMLGEGDVPLPCLTRLVLIDCILPWSSPIFSNLVHLEIQMPIHVHATNSSARKPSQDDLFSILRAATGLRTLILAHGACTSESMAAQVLPLPHLENLTLRGHAMHMAYFYASIRIPTAATVVLKLSSFYVFDEQGSVLEVMLPLLCMRDRADGVFSPNMLSIVAADIKPADADMVDVKFQLSNISALDHQHPQCGPASAYREIVASNSKPLYTLRFYFFLHHYNARSNVLGMVYRNLPLDAVHTLFVAGTRLQTKVWWERLFRRSTEADNNHIHTLYVDALGEAYQCALPLCPEPDSGAPLFPSLRHVGVREPGPFLEIDTLALVHRVASVRKLGGTSPEFWINAAGEYVAAEALLRSSSLPNDGVLD
ncbi:hypothetical protein DENSPDRAFT_333151 [Dentipellis sp. KUC8613]|nr:hypothetical protein DENSPDRAFT_333151 [Dentipellis sp. KUC8613]